VIIFGFRIHHSASEILLRATYVDAIADRCAPDSFSPNAAEPRERERERDLQRGIGFPRAYARVARL
jgi:hypothetical protein